MSKQVGDLDMASNKIANLIATETVAVATDLFLFIDATDGNVKGLDHADLPGGTAPVALADVVDRYVWSYDTYDAAATVITQPVVAPGNITAVQITALTANTGGETWAIEKNRSDTTEEVVLAGAATKTRDTTGWTTTVVAGDELAVNPESAPSVASTWGTIVIEVTRT